jgi:hypothetical protein
MRMSDVSIQQNGITELLSHLPDGNLSVAIALESNRLAVKYGKDVFNAEDLVQILGVGLNNVRELMNRPSFPTLCFKGRKVVSSLGLAMYFAHRNARGGN